MRKAKASLKNINTETQQIRVAGIEVNNLNENIFNNSLLIKHLLYWQRTMNSLVKRRQSFRIRYAVNSLKFVAQ